jgi:hypothetical protein
MTSGGRQPVAQTHGFGTTVTSWRVFRFKTISAPFQKLS